MVVRSITRIGGKIRIISSTSAQRRVNEFEDYGLPELDYLVKLLNSVKQGKEYYVLNYHLLIISYYARLLDPYIQIHCYNPTRVINIRRFDTIIYNADYVCIMHGRARLSTDISPYRPEICWLRKKHIAEIFDGKHITEHSFREYAAVVGEDVLANFANHKADQFTKMYKL